MTSNLSEVSHNFGTVPDELKMANWPAEARELDKSLYSTLLSAVKGQKRSIIAGLRVPSYVAAMATLWINDSVSHTDRKLRALEKLQKLEYKGNVDTYYSQAHSCIREFYNSGITLEDIVLLAVRDSFENRYRQVKIDVGKDIDSDCDKRHCILDLVQKYCRLIASAGDGNTNKQNLNEDPNGKGGKEKKGDRKGRKGDRKGDRRGKGDWKKGDGKDKGGRGNGKPDEKNTGAGKEQLNLEEMKSALEKVFKSRKKGSDY